jgi:uncharacterized protein (DUF488 family)
VNLSLTLTREDAAGNGGLMFIATVGYEGSTPADFDRTLAEANIDYVVDVRAVPVSRKKGFSKTALRARLEEAGIGYLHLRALGDPKPGRDAARAGNWQMFRRIFFAHMETSAAQVELAQLREITMGRRVALLCYEADHTQCHRAIVTALLAPRANLDVDHLKVVPSGGEGGVKRASDHSRQSLAAA